MLILNLLGALYKKRRQLSSGNEPVASSFLSVEKWGFFGNYSYFGRLELL